MQLSPVLNRLSRIRLLVRGQILSFYIRTGGGRVGRRLEVEKGVSLKRPPHSGIRIGNNVHLGRGAILDVPRGAKLVLHDEVKVMQYTMIAAAESIEIGRSSQVAELCSIRDSDHGVGRDRPMSDQLVSTPTVLGSDVWVGRGCAVLRGSAIGDGAVIGANSVVKGSIPSMAIAFGSPARVQKRR